MSFRNSWSASVEMSGPSDVERLLFGLLLGLDDLDVQLLEHAVELVDLSGVKRQLVERDRDLLRSELSRLTPSLKELPRLLGFEDAPRRPRTYCSLLPSAQLRSPSRTLTVLAVCEKSTLRKILMWQSFN